MCYMHRPRVANVAGPTSRYEIMSSFTDIQQAFVHRYIDHDGVNGVRVAKIDDEMVLLVEVDNVDAAQLPEEFRGLPVRVCESGRAVLAYR
jgi:hypothetical protein